MTGVPSWINKRTNAVPEWVAEHSTNAGKREPNGTFLIRTRPLSKWHKNEKPLSARVLVGNIVLLWSDVAYTAPAAEAKELLAGLEAEVAPAPPKPVGYDFAPRSEADVADRTDDTDDISLRIRAAKIQVGQSVQSEKPGRSDRTILTQNDAIFTGQPDPAARIDMKPAASGAHETTAARTKPQRRAEGAVPVRQQAYPPALGSRPTIEWLHVDRLTLDISYQRSTDNDASRRLIASIAAKFDWRLCTPLVVSRRPDGDFAVIDGQHRLLAARLRNMDDLPCCVFTYDSPQDEAKMFVAANRSRKPMNRLDDFHAAIAAGDDEALQIRQIITDAGLSVARNTSSSAWAAGEIAFTGSVARVLRKHGAAITQQALTMVAEAFPDQKVTHAGSIFQGLVKVLTGPQLGHDQDRLFRALLKYDADEWGSFVTGLKGGETRATAIRDALMMAYDETPGGGE